MIAQDRLFVALVCIVTIAFAVGLALREGRFRGPARLWLLLAPAYVVLASLAVLEPPVPLPPGVGLDPSWTVGLARAEAAGLVFGRQIVFTYGPLGYLVTRNADIGNASTMVILQLCAACLVFTAVVACIAVTASPFAKAILGGGAPLVMANASIELWPLFLVLLVFVYRVERGRAEPALLAGTGLVVGVFALTKFTVAIDAGLVAGTFFAAQAWLQRSNSAAFWETLEDAALFVYGTLASSAFRFVETDWSLAGAAVLEIGLAALVLAAVFLRRRLACGAAALAALAMLLSPSFREYVASSIAVAQGYSAALALDGPPWQVESAFVWLAALVVAMMIYRSQPAFSVAVALAIYAWTAFKIGFVRQDFHVIYFYVEATFAGILLTVCARSRRTLVAAYAVLAAASLVFANAVLSTNVGEIFVPLSITTISANVDLLTHLPAYATAVDAADVENSAADVLSAQVRRAIGGRPVDVIPTETEEAFASGLNWDPEPVFQTILASTPSLDRIDLQSLVQRRDDAIVYGFDSIDGRYPAGDEPATFAFILCNYEPLFPAVPSTPIALLRAKHSRCSAEPPDAERSIRFRAEISIPHAAGRVTIAKIRLRPTLAGRLLSFVFREAPASVRVRFADGTSHSYRVVTANAVEGLLADPVPRNSRDFAALFAAHPAMDAKTLRIDADGRWFEAPRIRFELLTIQPVKPPPQ